MREAGLPQQVKYGWSPRAALGPQMGRLAERQHAEALRDAAALMDYEASYGREAWQCSGAPAVLTDRSADPPLPYRHCLAADLSTAPRAMAS